LAGLVAPARSDGVSLLSDLAGKGTRPDSTVYVEYSVNGRTPDYVDFKAGRRGAKRGQMQMIRIGDLAGVRVDIQSHDDDFAIYDVVKDPSQRKNLAPELPEMRKTMKDRVLQIRRPDPASPRPYLDTLPLPPQPASANLQPGLDSLLFPPGLPWPGAWCESEGTKNGVASRPGEPTGHGLPGQCHVFRGILRVPETGTLVFGLSTPARSVLKLHGATILDTDKGAPTGEVRLAAGNHPVFFSVLAGEQGQIPSLQWSSPGGAMRTIPADHFFRSPDAHTRPVAR
jgi:hypothetical protein